MALSVAGFLVLVVAMPQEKRLRLSLDTVSPETLARAREIVDSPIAAFLDPPGHDRLVYALGRMGHRTTLEDLEGGYEALMRGDVTDATDHHQIAAREHAIWMLILLGCGFAMNLLGYVLWRRDSRSELWHAIGLPLSGMLLATAWVFHESARLGLTMILFVLACYATVGREAARALRFRMPDELDRKP
jgi:hypothetical protein